MKLGDDLVKLAIFDFDGTLFNKETLPIVGREWKRQHGNNIRYLQVYLSILPTVVLYKLGLIPRERLKYGATTRFHRIFRGMSKAEVHHLFSKVYQVIKPSLNPLMIREIQDCKNKGFHTILLSGAYRELLQKITDDLGIHRALGVELPYYQGRINLDSPISFISGEGKYELLQNALQGLDINWSESRSYADSYTDLPVLEIVGEPVVVNPEERLLKYARNNKWRILTG